MKSKYATTTKRGFKLLLRTKEPKNFRNTRVQSLRNPVKHCVKRKAKKHIVQRAKIDRIG